MLAYFRETFPAHRFSLIERDHGDTFPIGEHNVLRPSWLETATC